MPREYGKSRAHCLVSVLELFGFISARLIRLSLFVEVHAMLYMCRSFGELFLSLFYVFSEST